jgi:hypothetical protein
MEPHTNLVISVSRRQHHSETDFFTMATMITPSNFINDTNCKAVGYMQAGMHQAAVKELAKGMQFLSAYEPTGSQKANIYSVAYYNNKNNINTSTNSSSPTASIAHAAAELMKYNKTDGADHIPAFGIESIDVSSPSTNGRDFAGGNQGYVYDRAFVMVPFSAATNNDIMLCANFWTEAGAVLLYNTALAYHKRGLVAGTTYHLISATSLYNMILAMIAEGDQYAIGTRANEHETAGMHLSLAVVAMAVSNNLTQIYLEQFDAGPMRICRTLLRDMVRQVTRMQRVHQHQHQHQHQLSHPHHIIHVNDFTFFHLNLFCFERENFVISPAA